MLEAWIPLAEVRSPLAVPSAAQYTLPETCSIAAIRFGLQPLPFKAVDAVKATSAAPPGTTAAWPSLVDTVSLGSIALDAYTIARMSASGLSAVKELHPAAAVSACIDPSSFDSMSPQLTIHILSLVVDSRDRRAGLARKMVSAVIKALVAEYQAVIRQRTKQACSNSMSCTSLLASSSNRINSVQVVLHVASDNYGALQLYKQLGLTPIKRLRGYYRRRRDGGTGEAIEMSGTLPVD
ncbi:Cysteine-rich protein 2-binding protein [Microbotryomycetes sp. JL201]|nr:Cysteine-rich protein 2-binding protein [Microbotryomycetes sp. JL201]